MVGGIGYQPAERLAERQDNIGGAQLVRGRGGAIVRGGAPFEPGRGWAGSWDWPCRSAWQLVFPPANARSVAANVVTVEGNAGTVEAVQAGPLTSTPLRPLVVASKAVVPVPSSNFQ